MKKLWILPLVLPLMAASPPPQRFTLIVPAPSTDGLGVLPGTTIAPSPYEPAPLPNRELAAPTARSSSEPNVAPTLFSSKTQYRGDGFSSGSTAQSEQEKRAKPGAGFSLHMPLAPSN